MPNPIKEISSDETGGIADFTAVNLDCCSVQELAALSRVFSLLAAYSESRMRAMQHRLGGDIEAALSFERNGDATYRKLPEWAKW